VSGREGVRTGGGLFFNIDFVFRTSMRPFFSIFPLTIFKRAIMSDDIWLILNFVLTTTPVSIIKEVIYDGRNESNS